MMPPEEQSMTSTPISFKCLEKTTVSATDQPPSTSSIDETRTKSGLPFGHAVRRVQLDDLEAGTVRAPRGVDERLFHVLEVALLQRPRPEPVLADRRVDRRDDAPRRLAALGVGLGQRPVAVPRPRHARLAAGVGKLQGRNRALRLHELGNPAQAADMRVVPDAGVAMRDAPALLHRGGFDEHHARAALGELAQVHQVPVGDVAVLRRVLAHRRDDDAVADPDVAQPDLVEQHQFCFLALPASRVTADAEPLPFHCFSSTTSPRKLSSIVTSSGSLRKIWKSFASGKLRKCISTLCFWMRSRTSCGSLARKAIWSTEPDPVVPLGCFFSRNMSRVSFGSCEARCTQMLSPVFSQYPGNPKSGRSATSRPSTSW